MGVRFIREPSETPNISNSADARMVRYAYGGYDGVVKDKGTELSHTIDGSNFRLNSGVINLMGYEVEVDTNGWALDLSSVSTRRAYSVYLEVNLALQTAEIKSTYNSGTFVTPPPITTGDDLTANTAGTARLLLYNFIVNNGIVVTVIKKVSVIDYTKDIYAGLTNGEIIPKIASYASADFSKGTIETRLTNLGFREGSVTLASGITATRNSIKRQGNYVILDLQISGYYIMENTYQIGSVPSAFLPDTTVNLPVGYNIYVVASGAALINTTDAYFTITTSGTISLTITGVEEAASILEHIRTISGYVASPL